MSAAVILPNPIPPIVLGGSYVGAFGEVVTRVTQAAPGRWAGPEYPTRNAFNCAGTHYLVLEVDHFSVRQFGGGSIDFPHLGASSRPCWDPITPDWLWFREVGGTKLLTMDGVTGEIATAYDFGEEFDIDGGEGDITSEGWLPIVTNSRAFLFNIHTSALSPDLPLNGRRIESMYVMDNRVVVSWWTEGDGAFDGMRVYNSSMNKTEPEAVFKLAGKTAHKDLGFDADGAPVCVWCSSNEVNLPFGNVNGVVKTNLLTGEHTLLLELAWDLAFHVSLPDRLLAGVKPFAIVETSSVPLDHPKRIARAWAPYEREILRVPLDGSGIERLAHTRYLWREQDSDNNAGQSLATVSPDGKHVFFRSNLADYSAPANYCDGYMLELDAPAVTALPPVSEPTIPERVQALEIAMAKLQQRIG